MRRNTHYPDTNSRILPVHARLGERQAFVPNYPYPYNRTGAVGPYLHPVEPVHSANGDPQLGMSIPFTHRPPRDTHTYGQNPLLGPKIGPLGMHGGIPPVQQRLGPPGGHLHGRHLPPQLGYVSFTDSRVSPRSESFHRRREAEQKLQACLHSLEASTNLTEPPVKGEVESVEKLFGGLPVEPPCGPTLPFSDEEEEEGLSSSPIISEGLREVQDIIGSLSSHSMSDLSGSPHHTTQGLSDEPLQASSSGEAVKDDSIRQSKRYFNINNSPREAQDIGTKQYRPPDPRHETPRGYTGPPLQGEQPPNDCDVRSSQHATDYSDHPPGCSSYSSLSRTDLDEDSTRDPLPAAGGPVLPKLPSRPAPFHQGSPRFQPDTPVADVPSLMQAIPMELDSQSESQSDNEVITSYMTAPGMNHPEQEYYGPVENISTRPFLPLDRERGPQSSRNPMLRNLPHEASEYFFSGSSRSPLLEAQHCHSFGSNPRIAHHSRLPQHQHPLSNSEVRTTAWSSDSVNNLIESSKVSSLVSNKRDCGDFDSSTHKSDFSAGTGGKSDPSDRPIFQEETTSYLPFPEFAKSERLDARGIHLTGLTNLRNWVKNQMEVIVKNDFINRAHSLEIDIRTHMALAHWVETDARAVNASFSKLEVKREFFRSLSRSDMKTLWRDVAENIVIQEANDLLKHLEVTQFCIETRKYNKCLDPKWVAEKVGYLKLRESSPAIQELIRKAHRMKNIYTTMEKTGKSLPEVQKELAAAEKHMKEICVGIQVDDSNKETQEEEVTVPPRIPGKVPTQPPPAPEKVPAPPLPAPGNVPAPSSAPGKVPAPTSIPGKVPAPPAPEKVLRPLSIPGKVPAPSSAPEKVLRPLSIPGKVSIPPLIPEEGHTPPSVPDKSSDGIPHSSEIVDSVTETEKGEIAGTDSSVVTEAPVLPQTSNGDVDSKVSKSADIGPLQKSRDDKKVLAETITSTLTQAGSGQLADTESKPPMQFISTPSDSVCRIQASSTSRYYHLDEIGFASPKRLDSGSLPERHLSPLKVWAKKELDHLFRIKYLNQAHAREMDHRLVLMLAEWISTMKQNGREEVLNGHSIEREKKLMRKQVRNDVRNITIVVVENAAVEELRHLRQTGLLASTPLSKDMNYKKSISMEYFCERLGYVSLRAAKGEALAKEIERKVAEASLTIEKIVRKRQNTNTKSSKLPASLVVDEKTNKAVSEDTSDESLVKPVLKANPRKISIAPVQSLNLTTQESSKRAERHHVDQKVDSSHVASTSHPLKANPRKISIAPIQSLNLTSQESSKRAERHHVDQKVDSSHVASTSHPCTSSKTEPDHSSRDYSTQDKHTRVAATTTRGSYDALKSGTSRRTARDPRSRSPRRTSSLRSSRSRYRSRESYPSTEDSSVSPSRRRRRVSSSHRRKHESRSHHHDSDPSSSVGTRESSRTETEQTSESDLELLEMRRKLILSIHEKQNRGRQVDRGTNPSKVGTELVSSWAENSREEDGKKKDKDSKSESSSTFVYLGNSMIETVTTPTGAPPTLESLTSVTECVDGSTKTDSTMACLYEVVSDEECGSEQFGPSGGQNADSRRSSVGYTTNSPLNPPAGSTTMDVTGDQSTTDEDDCYNLVIDCSSTSGPSRVHCRDVEMGDSILDARDGTMVLETATPNQQGVCTNTPTPNQTTDDNDETLEEGEIAEDGDTLREEENEEKQCVATVDPKGESSVVQGVTGSTNVCGSELNLAETDATSGESHHKALDSEQRVSQSVEVHMKLGLSDLPVGGGSPEGPFGNKDTSTSGPSTLTPTSEPYLSPAKEPVVWTTSVNSSPVDMATITVLSIGEYSHSTDPLRNVPGTILHPFDASTTSASTTSASTTSASMTSASITSVSTSGVPTDGPSTSVTSKTGISTKLASNTIPVYGPHKGVKTVQSASVMKPRSPGSSDKPSEDKTKPPSVVKRNGPPAKTSTTLQERDQRLVYAVSIGDTASIKFTMGNIETWKPKGRFVIPVNEVDSESSDDETVPVSSKSSKLANTQNILPPSATSVSLRRQPSGSKVHESGNRGIQNASRTIGSESLPRKAKSSSKPVKSSGKSVESTSKLTGSDSALTGNLLSGNGSASQLTGSSLKSTQNETNLKSSENGSKAAGSVSMETNDIFHDAEVHGVQRLKSRKRSASSEAGVHHAKRKPSSSSTHPPSSYAGPLRSPAKLTAKTRSSDSNVVDVKKRLLRAKLIKCMQDVDQRNKTIAKQKGDIEQDHQRVRLLTQQLTSDTNEVTELEKKVEMLKKHLAATEKNLGAKQDRIKRLQKEVKNSMSLISDRMKQVVEEKKKLSEEKATMQRCREQWKHFSSVRLSTSSGHISVKKTASKRIITDDDSEQEPQAAANARKTTNKRVNADLETTEDQVPSRSVLVGEEPGKLATSKKGRTVVASKVTLAKGSDTAEERKPVVSESSEEEIDRVKQVEVGGIVKDDSKSDSVPSCVASPNTIKKNQPVLQIQKLKIDLDLKLKTIDEPGTAKKPAEDRSSPSSSETQGIAQSGSMIPFTTSLSHEEDHMVTDGSQMDTGVRMEPTTQTEATLESVTSSEVEPRQCTETPSEMDTTLQSDTHTWSSSGSSSGTAPETLHLENNVPTVQAEGRTETVMEEVSSRETVMEEVSSRETVTEKASSQETVMKEASSRETVMEEASSRETVMEEASGRETVMEEVSSPETVTEKASSQETVMKEASSQETVMEEASGRETVMEEVSSRETVMEEASSRETVMKEASSQETVMKEPSSQETVMEEVSSWETVMEEVSSRETVMEEVSSRETVPSLVSQPPTTSTSTSTSTAVHHTKQDKEEEATNQRMTVKGTSSGSNVQNSQPGCSSSVKPVTEATLPIAASLHSTVPSQQGTSTVGPRPQDVAVRVTSALQRNLSPQVSPPRSISRVKPAPMHRTLLEGGHCIPLQKNWILELCAKWSELDEEDLQGCRIKHGLLGLVRKDEMSTSNLLFSNFTEANSEGSPSNGGGKLLSSTLRRTRGYKPYSSPLTCLKSYRLSPLFWNSKPSLSTSQTFVNKIDPHGTLCRYDLLGKCRDPECNKQHLSKAMDVSEREIIEDVASYDLRAIGIKEQQLRSTYGAKSEDIIKGLLSKQAKHYLGKYKFSRFLTFLLEKINLHEKEEKKGVSLITHSKLSTDQALPLSRFHGNQTAPTKSHLLTSEPGETKKVDIEGLLSWPIGVPVVREVDKSSDQGGRYFAPSVDAQMMDLEKYLEKCPSDVESWIKMADQVKQTYSNEEASLKASAKVLEKAMELSHSSRLICKYIGVQKELVRQGLMEEGSIEEGVVKILSSSEERDITRASSAAVILECAWAKSSVSEKVDVIMKFIPLVIKFKDETTASSDVVELLLVAVQADVVLNHHDVAINRMKAFIESLLHHLLPDHCVFVWLCYVCLKCTDKLPSHLFESGASLDDKTPPRLLSLSPFVLSPGEWIRDSTSQYRSHRGTPDALVRTHLSDKQDNNTLCREELNESERHEGEQDDDTQHGGKPDGTTQRRDELGNSTQRRDELGNSTQRRDEHDDNMQWCNLIACAIKSCYGLMGEFPHYVVQLHLAPLWLSLASVNESFGYRSLCVEWRRAMVEKVRGSFDFMKWYSLELAVMDPKITTKVLRDALVRHPGDTLLSFVFARHELSLGHVKESQNCLRAVVQGFLSDSEDRRCCESPRSIVMVFRKLLGQYVPESCVNALPSITPGAVNHSNIVYIWLCYSLYSQAIHHPVEDVVVEKYTNTVDIYEAALHSNTNLADQKLIWKEYLKYLCNLACQTNSTLQNFKEFTECTHRSLLAVDVKEVVSRSECDCLVQFKNYDFHNEVVELYMKTLPPQDRPLVYKQWAKVLPDNEGLLVRAAKLVLTLGHMDVEWLQEWVASFLLDHKRSVVVWKIAIALEYRLHHYLEVRWLYKEAVKNVPLCGQLWREYFEFELEQLQRDKKSLNVSSAAEEVNRIRSSAEAVGVSLQRFNLQRTSCDSGPAVAVGDP